MPFLDHIWLEWLDRVETTFKTIEGDADVHIGKHSTIGH